MESSDRLLRVEVHKEANTEEMETGTQRTNIADKSEKELEKEMKRKEKAEQKQKAEAAKQERERVKKDAKLAQQEKHRLEKEKPAQLKREAKDKCKTDKKMKIKSKEPDDIINAKKAAMLDIHKDTNLQGFQVDPDSLSDTQVDNDNTRKILTKDDSNAGGIRDICSSTHMQKSKTTTGTPGGSTVSSGQVKQLTTGFNTTANESGSLEKTEVSATNKQFEVPNVRKKQEQLRIPGAFCKSTSSDHQPAPPSPRDGGKMHQITAGFNKPATSGHIPGITGGGTRRMATTSQQSSPHISSKIHQMAAAYEKDTNDKDSHSTKTSGSKGAKQ
jgi:hypothetical protein